MIQYHKIKTVFKRDPETKFKTLLTRHYSIPEFEYLKDNIWVFTEKVDGMNIRVMWDGVAVTFGGKTDRANIPQNLVNRLTERFQTPMLKEKFGEDESICLYGEGYGAGIQKGGSYRPDQDFVLFDVKIGDWWLQRNDVEDVAHSLGIDIVPILGEGTLADMVEMASEGFHSIWGSCIAEGIVARPATELKTRSGQRVITKIKYKDFVR